VDASSSSTPRVVREITSSMGALLRARVDWNICVVDVDVEIENGVVVVVDALGTKLLAGTAVINIVVVAIATNATTVILGMFIIILLYDCTSSSMSRSMEQ
jgi:hypothetical protein